MTAEASQEEGFSILFSEDCSPHEVPGQALNRACDPGYHSPLSPLYPALRTGRQPAAVRIAAAVCSRWDLWGRVPHLMTILDASELEMGAGLAALAVLGAVAIWLIFHKRPGADELERARRRFLVQSGRLVDGMLLDVCEVPAKDGRTLIMLIFNYRIGGVDYECSQDITRMSDVVDAARVRAGFPCTVRYQPGNPQNSIVVAEGWTGLRAGLPALPALEDQKPPDQRRLRSGGS